MCYNTYCRNVRSFARLGKGTNALARRALYREYRPETFSEVIGQDHITTILKNQVRENKLSHAYLFCGSRGTGKTSSAKILARAANCLDPKDGEPCGQCAACRLVAAGSADVIEIDAASNNSVDNVRSLIEQAQFAPLELRYRVFIIDEVHMLSNAAFNALLKTLEEPPKHVLFILATTEPQKLPATIVSRCQRFDFHRLTIAHIVTNLSAVLQKAGASIEPNGLRLIARAADGGMRDALSLADQCLSYAGNTVREQDVLDALGTVSGAVLEDAAKALLSGDAKNAVRVLDDVVRSGRDLGVFLADLSRHFRALLLSKTCGDCADLLDCTDDQMQRYLKIAKETDEARILYAMEQILAVQSKLRLFPAPRIPIETTFVRICRPVDDLSLSALEARVALLETRPAACRDAGAEGRSAVGGTRARRETAGGTRARTGTGSRAGRNSARTGGQRGGSALGAGKEEDHGDEPDGLFLREGNARRVDERRRSDRRIPADAGKQPERHARGAQYEDREGRDRRGTSGHGALVPARGACERKRRKTEGAFRKLSGDQITEVTTWQEADSRWAAA